MAKKNNKQQQKRLQKKREKRKDRGRPSSPAKAGGVGEPFLEACWQDSPMPRPPELAEELESFDALAQQALESGQVPDRHALAVDLGDRMQKVVTQESLTDIGRWMYTFCDGQVQQQRVLRTLEAIPESHWPFQTNVLRFLLSKWGEALPERLSRWLPLWIQVFGDVRLPDLSTLGAERSIVDAYDDILAYGRALAWSAGPADFYASLMEPVLAKAGAELRTLTELLSDYWGEFVYHPASPDWVIHVAETLEEREQPDDAYALLLKVSERTPEAFDVHEILARLALLMEKPPDVVRQHARRGLESLAGQPDESVVDPVARDEFKLRLEAYLQDE